MAGLPFVWNDASRNRKKIVNSMSLLVKLILSVIIFSLIISIIPIVGNLSSGEKKLCLGVGRQSNVTHP